ncbi:MAG: hypothetical protein ABUK01_08515 [Leptospirales bacterium]
MKPNWFVAFSVSPDSWYEEVYKTVEEPMYKYHPEDLHSTVAFFGSLDEEGVERVKRVMDTFDEKSLLVTLGKLLFLPTLQKYSAVSYSVDEGNAVLQNYIQKYRDQFFIAAKQDVDSRPPLPHVTIVRPPKKTTVGENRKFSKSIQKLSTPRNKILINTLSLYTWSENRSFCQDRQYKEIYSVKMN